MRGLNKSAVPILVGTKFDIYSEMPEAEQADVLKQARKFAKAMKAPLIFSSCSHSINVQKLFKVVLAKAFDLKLTMAPVLELGQPIVELR